MIPSVKQHESELLAAVKANRNDPGVYALLQLLEHRLTKQDKILRACTVDEFPAAQAKAAVFAALISEISS